MPPSVDELHGSEPVVPVVDVKPVPVEDPDPIESIVKETSDVPYNTLLLGTFFIALISLFGVAFLVSNMIPSGSVLDAKVLTPTPSSDVNSFEEHLALAGNQQTILREIQELNLLSDCVIDTENIRNGEIPIDDQGGFRKVSVVPLVCPRLAGVDST